MGNFHEGRAEVQRAFDAALAYADSAEKRPFFEFERELWRLMLALGRALAAIFLARQAARPREIEYWRGQQRFVLVGDERTTKIGTRFGKVEFRRPVARPIGGTKSKMDLPIDRELGLCGGFSLGTVVAIARLAAMMAFAPARQTFQEFHGWMPSSRAALRMVDGIGEQARPFLEQAPAPEDDGEILIIQPDGRGAPMITFTEYDRRARPHGKRDGTKRAWRRRRKRENPRPRRNKGDKSKNAKIALIGVIYTLRKTKDGYEGPINKRVIGTFGTHSELMTWLRSEADKRGYGKKRTIFLADGSAHIWREKAKHFPDAEGCIDWYHIAEKFWEAGRFFHREGSPELAKWVKTQLKLLREGKAWTAIDTLAKLRSRVPMTGPGTKTKRERLDDIIIHLGEHAEHMRYDRLRRDGLDIATGAVEGAVRNVVAVRLDGPGMRWGRQRSELVLHLRCILVSGLWPDFVAFLAAKQAITLRAQPIEASPHAAAA
jgi:hypothetical protein